MLAFSRRSLPIRPLFLVFSLAGLASAQVSITTGNPLTPGTVGQPYSQTLAATGGTSPYAFSITGGSQPPGIMLSSSGLLSGTPTSAGTFSFTVQAVDSFRLSATTGFTLTINPATLTITTQSPLFPATIGQPYVQPFTAGNGVPPYAWTIASGNTGGLTLMTLNSSEVLSGTPQAVGTFTFTIQVTDSAHGLAQQTYSVVVSAPTLTLSVVSSLASGTVGAPYSQKLPVLATGGVPPYTWSLGSSPVPGLTFDPVAIALSGTPTKAGSFNLTVNVADSAGNTATNQNLTLTIASAALTITTPAQLAAGALASAYSQTLAAIGGAPPYAWSATGLPSGLTLNSTTGLISGTLAAAGNFSVVVTVTDSALTTYKNLFSISVSYPPTPAVTFSGLPATASAAQQYPLQVTLGAAYPVAITGQATLTFAPTTGPADSTIQFASGGTTASFSIAAGTTTIASTTPIALQTGTVSGTLTVSLRLLAGGVDITPNPAPAITTQLAAAAPVISSLQTSLTNNTLSLMVTGYSTARSVTQAVFTFSAAAGQSLQTAASTITIDVSSLFGTWFVSPTNSQYGSQFIFTQPFTITGTASAVIPVSVTLTNSTGSVTKSF
jgi:hypothetical protein